MAAGSSYAPLQVRRRLVTVRKSTAIKCPPSIISVVSDTKHQSRLCGKTLVDSSVVLADGEPV